MTATPVAIAGCGAVSAAGFGLAPLRTAMANNTSHLRQRECAIGRLSLPVCAGFVPDDVTMRLQTADAGHAASRPFLLAAAALEQAATEGAASFAAVPMKRRGLVLSTTKANIDALDETVAGGICPPYAQRQIHPAFLARDLAAHAGCGGPMQCVSAACVSGLLALQQGTAFIRRGHADAVLVVGVDVISHFVLAGFNTLKSLDPEGCRPFDRARVGLSLGEGAGAVLLVSGERVPPPRILLAGFGSSNDANHLTGPSRDGCGLALAIRRAFSNAGCSPEDLDYVNAHGTGTPYNDRMESLAFRGVFGERVPPCGASKGIFGHTLGAAGVLETVICVLALQGDLLPGTPRLGSPDPVAPGSLLVGPRPVHGLARMLKVNCGFAGTNAALVLEREPA